MYPGGCGHIGAAVLYYTLAKQPMSGRHDPPIRARPSCVCPHTSERASTRTCASARAHRACWRSERTCENLRGLSSFGSAMVPETKTMMLIVWPVMTGCASRVVTVCLHASKARLWSFSTMEVAPCARAAMRWGVGVRACAGQG